MLGNTKFITLEAAKMMMAAGEAEARKNNWDVAIAIVDGGANLVLFHKMDNAQPGGVAVSIGKAKTAANFKRPTAALEEMINGGRTAFAAVEGITPVQGGLPIIVDGQLIGAVGVSGVRSAEDEQIAAAAIAALIENPKRG